MNYLLLGSTLKITDEIEKIKQQEGITENSVSKYDMLENNLEDAIDDLNTISLFMEKKLVVIKNIDSIKDDKVLKDYLKNSSDNILILTAESLTKKIEYPNCKIIDFSKIDFTDYIKQELKDYKIDYLTINEIKDRVGNNFGVLKQELEKLKLYKDKEITKEDVKLVVSKNYDYNIFDLTNAINKKDRKRAIQVYEELITSGEDEIKLIGTLAKEFRLLHQIKILRLTNNDDEIIKKYNFKPYRYKMLKQQSSTYTNEELEKCLQTLSNIDIAIKSGKMTKEIALPMFFKEI